jgi:hypothetical protein
VGVAKISLQDIASMVFPLCSMWLSINLRLKINKSIIPTKQLAIELQYT